MSASWPRPASTYAWSLHRTAPAPQTPPGLCAAPAACPASHGPTCLVLPREALGAGTWPASAPRGSYSPDYKAAPPHPVPVGEQNAIRGCGVSGSPRGLTWAATPLGFPKLGSLTLLNPRLISLFQERRGLVWGHRILLKGEKRYRQSEGARAQASPWGFLQRSHPKAEMLEMEKRIGAASQARWALPT